MDFYGFHESHEFRSFSMVFGLTFVPNLCAERHGFALNTIPPLTPTMPNAGFDGNCPLHWGYEMS